MYGNFDFGYFLNKYEHTIELTFDNDKNILKNVNDDGVIVVHQVHVYAIILIMCR
jgi:hypothetical protein